MATQLVVALDRRLGAAVADHVRLLLGSAVRVVLVLPDEAAVRAAGLPPDPGLRVVALVPDERRLKLARVVPRRLYDVLARPWVLGCRWGSLRARVELTEVGRVVAADLAATTLVWHLCRHNPHVVATTALDRP